MIANYFFKYWQHALALLIGVVLALVFEPSDFTKYKGGLESDQGKLLAEGQKTYYADLDGDGLSEEYIYYHLSDSKQPVVNKNNAEGDFEYIWYLDGKVVNHFDFLTGDYDSDGKDELYLFSIDKGGLYLYAIDGSQSNLFVVEKTLITKLKGLNNEHQIVIRPGGLYDLNKDGLKEAVFTVSNRYEEAPRRVFSYDIKNDKVISSPELGLQLVGKPNVLDINNDGEYEIFISTLNSINYTSNTGLMPTLRSETVVLDANLQRKFPPYSYTAKMSVSSTFPYANATDSGYVSLNWTLSENIEGKLALFSNTGELKKELLLAKESFLFDQSRKEWNDIRTFSRSGKIKHYNSNLQLTKSLNIGSKINQVAYIDVNRDGIEELLMVKENSLLIYQHDYSSFVEVHIPGIGTQKLLLSIKENGGERNVLSLQNKIYQYDIYYYKNPNYWFKYLYFLAVSFIVLGIFVILKFLYGRHIELIKKSERESTYMHIDLVKNQLDPHFLFNALNSIAFSVNKDDRKTAYRNIGIFSKFMREAIVSIDDYGRSLEDELSFVKYYLELEKFRFKEKFEYNIIVSPKVSTTVKIPKMCIFSYVESALKKGVLPKAEGGNIEINIDVTTEHVLVVKIIDDGLHRSLEFEKGNTKSMKVMERSIKFYNKLNAYPIQVSYADKGTAENPKGSIVEMHIPMDFNYD